MLLRLGGSGGGCGEFLGEGLVTSAESIELISEIGLILLLFIIGLEINLTEKDIVNRAITQETMKRQQDIITKLLESEKAEREREQDEQRKSNEAKNQNLSNPKQFLEYKRVKEKEL